MKQTTLGKTHNIYISIYIIYIICNIHTHIHTYTHTYINTYIHTYIHTYTQSKHGVEHLGSCIPPDLPSSPPPPPSAIRTHTRMCAYTHSRRARSRTHMQASPSPPHAQPRIIASSANVPGAAASRRKHEKLPSGPQTAIRAVPTTPATAAEAAPAIAMSSGRVIGRSSLGHLRHTTRCQTTVWIFFGFFGSSCAAVLGSHIGGAAPTPAE